MYYLRTRPATNAIKFTVDVEALLKESCEGIDLKMFNSKVVPEGQTEADKENIQQPQVLQSQSLNEQNVTPAQNGEDEKKPAAAPVACPLRKRKKNENGEMVFDDGECLACGS